MKSPRAKHPTQTHGFPQSVSVPRKAGHYGNNDRSAHHTWSFSNLVTLEKRAKISLRSSSDKRMPFSDSIIRDSPTLSPVVSVTSQGRTLWVVVFDRDPTRFSALRVEGKFELELASKRRRQKCPDRELIMLRRTLDGVSARSRICCRSRTVLLVSYTQRLHCFYRSPLLWRSPHLFA